MNKNSTYPRAELSTVIPYRRGQRHQVPECQGSGETYLDGNRHHLAVGVQVQQDERSHQVVLLPVHSVGSEAVKQPIIHQEYVSSLHEHQSTQRQTSHTG